MKNARSQSSIGLATREDIREVHDSSRTARCDNRNADGFAYRGSQVAIKTIARSVRVH